PTLTGRGGLCPPLRSRPNLGGLVFARSASSRRHSDKAHLSDSILSFDLAKAVGMKILVVDDHALIRDSLRSVLRELVEDAIALEAPDCRQAMRLIEQHPDLHLILLDVAPDRDGFSALAEVRERYPAISIVVLSGQPDRASVVKAFDLGARGFIPKSVQREVMRSALQLVFAGGIYVPPEILTRGTRHTSPADLGLIPRQLDVLKLMLQGRSNEAICRELDLSEQTVKTLIAAILKALKKFGRG